MNSLSFIYLDNAATTQLCSQAYEAMEPFMKMDYGNASSVHQLGQRANVAVEEAREIIAGIIHAEPSEIIFTSGGTESNNAAIFGVLRQHPEGAILTSPLEHHAVLHPVEATVKMGATCHWLKPNSDGSISPSSVEKRLGRRVALVTLMHANNEIGTFNPIAVIGKQCQRSNVPLHVDAVQTMGKIPVHVDELNLDLLSASAHKFHGPKGVGFLYVRSGSPWAPWMLGGAQERRRRAGTLNVPGIVGMAKALEVAHDSMDVNKKHISRLKTMLLEGLVHRFGEQIKINGQGNEGIHHILNVSFISQSRLALDGEMLLLNLDMEGICLSNGSACTSGAIEASHVLLGIGIDETTAKSSLRFSLSRFTTESEIQTTLKALERVLERMLAPC